MVCFASQNKGVMWKELNKCLDKDSPKCLVNRYKSDDFNSFLMHLFF